MKWVLDILKGVVIGLANIIPGVSGGTMMVSMGIYDTLIHCITHLFKELKKSIVTLLPYGIGMALAIIVGAKVLGTAFDAFPLPTNTLFIGLILGSVPAIWTEMKHEKKGKPGIIVFVLLFALVVALKVVEGDKAGTIVLSVGEVIKLFFLGCIASATMVIPGVSGSMILKTLGYYEPVMKAIPAAVEALTSGSWSVLLTNLGILVPFAVGIVVGIFGIAKLIEVLMAKWKGVTYCGIMGMVAASPVVILMDPGTFAHANVWHIVACEVTLILGYVIALKFSGEKNTPIAK